VTLRPGLRPGAEVVIGTLSGVRELCRPWDICDSVPVGTEGNIGGEFGGDTGPGATA
jgi:hypothetical protein